MYDYDIKCFFFKLFPDDGNNLVGLRSVQQTGHGYPGMGGRLRNMASLPGYVRIDIRVHRSNRCSDFVVLRRLPGTRPTSHGRKYKPSWTLQWFVGFKFIYFKYDSNKKSPDDIILDLRAFFNSCPFVYCLHVSEPLFYYITKKIKIFWILKNRRIFSSYSL